MTGALSSPLAICMLGLALLAWGATRRRRLSWLGAALLALGLLAMTPAFANLLLRWVEVADHQQGDCSTPQVVGVVLAGGVDQRPASDDDFGALSITSRRRVERAVRWWQESPGRMLVFSGGAPGWEPRIAEARLMAAYARRLGVSGSAIRLEEASRNTWDNARNLARLQPPLPVHVTMITSSIHVRRARYAMTQAGFVICAVPADSRVTPLHWPGALLPQSRATSKTEDAMHELIGMLYYRWLALEEND